MHATASPRHSTVVMAAGMLAAIAMLALMAVGPVRAATHAVAIRSFAYAPATITVTAGDTVTWTNEDSVAHTATSSTGAFDTGLLDQGESGSVTFTTPGTYSYFCEPHPSMTGQVVVQAAVATQAPSAPTSAPAPAGGGQELPDVATEVTWSGAGVIATVIGALLVIGAIGLALLTRRRSA